MADGIVGADERGVAPGAARVEAVIESLAASGVKIDAPYLEQLAGRATCPLTVCSLDAAASIGRSIVADAVWHNGSCSWVGAAAGAPGSTAAEYHALGPDLYGGTAGVGVSLPISPTQPGTGYFAVPPLASYSRDGTSEALAGEPARRISRRVSRGGVGGRACRAAAGGGSAARSGRRTVGPAGRPVARPDRCPDLVIGMAGSALGLLALADELDEHRLAEQARATGEILISRATVTSYGWSWAIPGSRHPAHLCGVSHGASGIGWALLELFAATGDDRFRTGATGAFAYERSWLDRSAGRWPDLRIAGQRRGPLAAIDSGITGTWCYGEAGIALRGCARWPC